MKNKSVKDREQKSRAAVEGGLFVALLLHAAKIEATGNDTDKKVREAIRTLSKGA